MKTLLLSLLLLLFPFWSVAASYMGARSLFALAGWRVRLWFLILPILAYVTLLGGLTALFAFVIEPPG